MQVKTILLGATNRISRHPVVLFTLGEKNTSVAEKLARQAVEVQKVIGIPGMKIIDTGANGNHFGFECIHPELGRDLIRYISLLAFEIDRNADLTERTVDLRPKYPISGNRVSSTMRPKSPVGWVFPGTLLQKVTVRLLRWDKVFIDGFSGRHLLRSRPKSARCSARPRTSWARCCMTLDYPFRSKRWRLPLTTHST